jgi:hypothetical protein
MHLQKLLEDIRAFEKVVESYAPTVPALEELLAQGDALTARHNAIAGEIKTAEADIARLKAEEADAANLLIEAKLKKSETQKAGATRGGIASERAQREQDLDLLQSKLHATQVEIGDLKTKFISRMHRAREQAMDDFLPIYNEAGKLFEQVWQIARARASASDSREWNLSLGRCQIFGASSLSPLFDSDIRKRGLDPVTGRPGWETSPSWTGNEQAMVDHDLFAPNFKRGAAIVRFAERVDEKRRERMLQEKIRVDRASGDKLILAR